MDSQHKFILYHYPKKEEIRDIKALRNNIVKKWLVNQRFLFGLVLF